MPGPRRLRFRAACAALALFVGALSSCGDDEPNLSPTREATDEEQTGSSSSVTSTTTDPNAPATTPTTTCDYAVLAMNRVAENAARATDGDEASKAEAIATLEELPGDLEGEAASAAANWADSMREFLEDPEASRDEMISAEWITETARVQEKVSQSCS